MPYMALYRKFRPRTFDQVKGQDHVVRTLKNQIKNNRIGHAYLFCGTRGTGKTSVAKLFAKAINCLEPYGGEPCGHCENCLAASKDSFMDVVEVDAASNTGVDDIRRIIEEVMYTPVRGRYKVYIIDEVHMLSGSAFNAFLKTLEEPPAYAVFILATTEPHKLPITILSRCQRYDFHRIGTDVIADNLKTLIDSEGVEADEKALKFIARAGDGSMRDSVSLLDKCISFNLGERLTYENVLETLGASDTDVFSRTFRAVYSGNGIAALKEMEKSVDAGGDLTRFVTDFIWYLRNLLLINTDEETGAEMLGVSEENLKVLKSDAKQADPEVLMRYIRVLSGLLNDLRYSPSKQVLTEVAFIKLARPQMETDTSSILDRIRQLESGAAIGVAAGGTKEENSLIKEERINEPAQAEMPEKHTERAPLPQTEVKAGKDSDSGISGAMTAERSWADIVDAVEDRFVRMTLKKTSVRAEGEESLKIYAAGNIAAAKIREKAADIEAAIIKVTGCAVRVSTAVGEPGPGHAPAPAPALSPRNREPLNNSEPLNNANNDLFKNINFEITTEEN